MSSMKPVQSTAIQEFVEAAAMPPYREVVADVDSQIVNARWRWLHAEWEEDVERLVEAKVAIDMLLERRFEIMQSQDAEAA
jgi:hypothetical protein